MSRLVPKFVTEQYEGGARGFRAEKRRQLAAVKKAVEELRTGCAFFPCAEHPVNKIDEQLCILTAALSVKNWGK